MKNPTVPISEAYYHALLSELARHPGGMRRREIFELVADAMGLTAEQRAQRLPSGGLRFRQRIGWSLNMLKVAGYVEPAASGVWRLSEPGRELLASFPDRLPEEVTRRITRESRSTPGPGGAGEGPAEPPAVNPETPEERIDTAVREIRQAVARDLLERISQAPPSFFEELVLDLLHALGYGTSTEDLQRVGGSGDGGIDGIISLDRLGFEKVYVQAKRWQGSVGRPEVQGFFGALAGRRAKKGVFITTSTFSKDALEFGRQVSDSVVLIDGNRLTELMIEAGVGVSHREVKIPKVDGDYFDDL